MIISASYRTDIPAFYGEWFAKRLAVGYARVTNPNGGPPSTVSLAKADVQGFVFWTRNLATFFPVLDELAAADWPFLVQFTLTGYPSPLDAATIATERAVAQMREVHERFGAERVAWRYDPIVLSSLTPGSWHRETFTRLADALAGTVDEVVISFAQIYRKTARNLDHASRSHGFTWHDPESAEKRDLLSELKDVAIARGLVTSLCAQPHLIVEGVREARCIDAERLERIAGRTMTVPRRPHREGCGCWQSRDIGAYDTCPHGCAYCYAVSGRTVAKRNLARHDPDADFLVMPTATAKP